jgi:glutamate-1-semialdehyde 2,1-aminomutase
MHFASATVRRRQADLTTLGKIIGGGLPVAAYGGSAELMNHVAPLGPVYQAGTLAGNPLAMRAGIATLKELLRPGVYERIRAKSEIFAAGLRQALTESGISGQVNATESLATLFSAIFL